MMIKNEKKKKKKKEREKEVVLKPSPIMYIIGQGGKRG